MVRSRCYSHPQIPEGADYSNLSEVGLVSNILASHLPSWIRLILPWLRDAEAQGSSPCAWLMRKEEETTEE